MSGGGGGLFGTILNITSIFVPQLRPIAMVLGTMKAIDSGNPLALAQSAMGWGGMMGGGDYFGNVTEGGDFPTDSGGQYAFDDAMQGSIPDSGTLQNMVASGQAQDAASGAVDLARQNAIQSGDISSGYSTLDSIYNPQQFDTSALRSNLDLNTLGGYGAAHDLLTTGPMNSGAMDTMANTGTSVSNYFGSGGASDVASLGTDQVGALNPTTSESLSEGYDWNKTAPQNNPFNAGVDAINTKPAFDMSGGGTSFGAPQGNFGDAFNQAGQPQLGGGMTTTGDLSMQQSTGGSIWDKIKTGWGGQGGDNPMGPLQAGAKLAAGVGSYLGNRRQAKALDEMYQRGMETADPQAANRNFASQKWQENINNPETAWNEYQAGAGGIAMQDAAAKYAKAGRRNMLPQLQAQNKMNFMSHYIPEYRKSINPAQFGAGSGGAVSAAYMGAKPQLERDKYSGIWDAAGNVAQGGGLASLYDYFGS